MVDPVRSLLRPVLGLLLALGLAQAPLRAQLDPRLQASRTDFLDMYQQTSIRNPKPEIVSVFDFSRSMATIMFHPLFRNEDVESADESRYVEFTLVDEPAWNQHSIHAIANTPCADNYWNRVQVWSGFDVTPAGGINIVPWGNYISCFDIGAPSFGVRYAPHGTNPTLMMGGLQGVCRCLAET